MRVGDSAITNHSCGLLDTRERGSRRLDRAIVFALRLQPDAHALIVCGIHNRTECSTCLLVDAHSSSPIAIVPDTICAFRCSRIKWSRSEEHTSELQSHVNLVCRL